MTRDLPLARQALASYPIAPVRIRPVAAKFNAIFRVTAAGAAFALRVCAPLAVATPQTATVELEWAERLRGQGVAVPRVIPNRAGEAATTVIDGAGRARQCVLFEWVVGRRPGPRVGRGFATELGRLSARVNDDAAGWHRSAPAVLHADRVLYWPLPDRVPDSRSPYGSVFRDALERAESVVADLWRDSSRKRQLVHGDLHPWNIIRAPDGTLVPIDFQDMVWGLVEQDVSVTVSSLRRVDGTDGLTAAFRAGFESIRTWPDLSADVLEALVVARRLNQINLTINISTEDLSSYLTEHADRLGRWLKGAH